MTTFAYKTEPMPHQRKILKEHWNDEYYGILWEMGAGKTKLLLDNAGVLFAKGELDGLLVLAPKGAYLNWIRAEIPKHMSDQIPYCASFWRSKPNKKQKDQLEKVFDGTDGLDIFVINTEAMSHKSGQDACARFFKNHKQVMTCVDESSDIKNPKAKRTKAILKLRDKSKYRRILTGSPITQSPLDAYAQFEFLNRMALGHGSYYAFKTNYAEIVPVQMGHKKFHKIVGFRNLEDLKRRMSPISSRILKEDCMDLPDKIYTSRDVELTPEQKRLYKEMKELRVAEFEQGEIVSATEAVTAMMKLQQILCGHCRMEDGTTQFIPNNRIPEVLRLTEEMRGKIVIWCNFRADVVLLTDALNRAYGEGATTSFHGGDTGSARADNVERWQTDPHCRFMLATSAGSKGNTWVEANNVIYYSNFWSLMNRIQSEDRCHRRGQHKNVTYVDLVARGTLDERVIQALREKKNMADYVLNSWREILK